MAAAGPADVHTLRCCRNFVGLGSNQFLVKVQKGHVGSLRIHVPWQTLTTEPITINLHDVYVLLTEDQHSERQHVAEEIKRTKLAVWDCIARWRSQQSASAAGPQPGSLLSQDRIQVKIHNLHGRWDLNRSAIQRVSFDLDPHQKELCRKTRSVFFT